MFSLQIEIQNLTLDIMQLMHIYSALTLLVGNSFPMLWCIMCLVGC